MSNEIYDYIIVGSGFGGSVSAHRLTEKGYKVLVLEKGKEYQDEDFPKTNWNIPKFLWAPLFKCFGILKLTPFRKVFILSGVGVGGGSLVYANTLMTPPDEFFSNKVWAHLKNWKQELMPFYVKAKYMLGVAPNPWTFKEDEILKEVAKDMGREEHFANVDVGVYFGDPEKEVDPYFDGKGPLRKGCTGCAGCMVGCRFNAKNTLVKNYLYFARKNGAKVEAETLVDKVQYQQGHYLVSTYQSTSWFKRKKKVYKSRGIIFAGGVLGTMDLLLKQKYKYKTLAKLSDTLGEGIRTNSEMLCGVTAKTKLNNGVAISSVMNPDDNTHVEIVKYPTGSNAMRFLAGPAVAEGPSLIRIMKMTLKFFKRPFYYLNPKKEWAKNSIIFLVMQHLDSKMKMVYKKSIFGHLSLENEGEKVPAYIPSGAKVMQAYAQKVGGFPQSIVPEVAFNIPSTAHILGGTPMGKNNQDSVINDKMQVHSYPNMLVCDGSIVQCNIGVNPSLTITAMSEYAMSFIENKKGS